MLPHAEAERIMSKAIINRRVRNIGLYESALHSNASSFQADIISKRNIPEGIVIAEFLNPDLSCLDPSTLKDINKAATRIVRAILMDEVIGLVCDFDVDGVASSTIYYESLVKSFGCNPSRIKLFISERHNHGYGLTPEMMDKIQRSSPTPTLIITADQGSKSAEAISAHKAWSKVNGLISDVIVTDHHDLDVGKSLKDAFAFINPKRPDCEFPHEELCGAAVSLLVMSHVRKKLIDKGVRSPDSLLSMGSTLPLVSAATIAGNLSMCQPINRAFVKTGVRRINTSKDICWQAFRELTLPSNELVTPHALGSTLTPMINVASFMGKDGMLGVKYFVSDTLNEAQRYLMALTKLNDERKLVQQSLFNSMNSNAMQSVKDGVLGLCIYQANAQHDIHHTVAASIAQKYARPTIVFSPKSNKVTQVRLEMVEELKIDIFQKMVTLNQVDIGDDEYIEIKNTLDKIIPTFTLYSSFSGVPKFIRELSIEEATGMTRKSLFKGMGKRRHEFSSPYGTLVFDLTNHNKPKLLLEGVDELIGSVRSVSGISIQNIFAGIATEYPKLVSKFNGDTMAGEITVKIDNLDEFKDKFDQFVKYECAQSHVSLQACYYSDGEIPYDRHLDLPLVDELIQLEPFGGGFERPAFEFEAMISSVRSISDSGDYQIRFRWCRNDYDYSAVWKGLGHLPDLDRIVVGEKLWLLCEIGDNYSRNRSIQLNIVTIID